jgi:ubiquinone biosynthesis protein
MMMLSRSTIRRMRQVLLVAGKYGFGEIFAKIRLPVRKPVCLECEDSRRLSQWARLRRAMEELGPTTIKIGQVLAMRPDLVPWELCEELRSFQEDLPGDNEKDLKAELRNAYGDPSRIFSEFEPVAVSAASLSQVHRAVLADTGQTVAVKVRRHGIVELVKADLTLFAYLADLLNDHVEAFRSARLPDMAEEARKNLLREIDFTNEARNIAHFNRLFGSSERVCAPRVFDAYTRPQAIVMEFLPGTRLDRFEGEASVRRALAEAGFECVVKQMLDHGFFHADPHLGNLKVVGGDKLCYYDWGMVGRLTPDMRSALVDYIIALAENDPELVARVALEMAVDVPPDLDHQRFTADVMFVLEQVHSGSGREVNLGRFLVELTSLCRSYNIFLRSDYILMARALLSTEAAGRTIDPQFNSMSALRAIGAEYVARRRSLIFSDRPIFKSIGQNVKVLSEMPNRFDRILRQLERGELSVQIAQKDQAKQLKGLQRSAYVISIGLITASLVVGSSLIYVSNIGPHAYGFPVFGLVGFSLSGLFAAWVILKMLRG